MRGICSVCQSEQSLRLSKKDENEYDDFDDSWESDYLQVVDTHDFYGEQCDGSGQVPEIVLKDE